jgi:hypothetical protein
MVLTYRDVSSLHGKYWLCIELYSAKSAEATVRRLGQMIPPMFREQPVEVFIPVVKRDIGSWELAHNNLIFARTQDDAMVFRLRKECTGLAMIMCSSEGERVTRAIKMPDADMQTLIAHCEVMRAKESEGIVVGSFVRIQDGGSKHLCGCVDGIANGMADVRVNYLSKFIYVTTPVRNLLNLDHVEPGKRVYYYGPLVEEVDDVSLLAEDLVMDEEVQPPGSMAPIYPRGSRGIRERTTMASLRAIVEAGERDPRTLATKVLQRMKDGDTETIGTLFMLHVFVKQLLAPHYAECKNWREAQRKIGYHFGVPELKAISDRMGLNIEEKTPGDKKRVTMRTKIDWTDPEAVKAYQKERRVRLAAAASPQG